MITYDTGGGAYRIQSTDFLISPATLNSTTFTGLSSPTWNNGYTIPISFFVYNDAGDTIDKVIFKDDYNSYDFTHEVNIFTDEYRVIGFFNQTGVAPSYNPNNYFDPIVCHWSNLGHTYTGKGFYIRVFHYFSTKLF